MKLFEIVGLREESPNLKKPFFKEVTINGYDLTAKSSGRNDLTISVYVGNTTVGTAQFWKSGKSLSSEKTSVSPEYQRQGIATLMYQFAKSLGFSVEPSKEKTLSGQALWKGLADKGSLSKKAILSKGFK